MRMFFMDAIVTMAGLVQIALNLYAPQELTQDLQLQHTKLLH